MSYSRVSFLLSLCLFLFGISYAQTKSKKNLTSDKEPQIENFEEVTDADEYKVFSTFLNSYLGVRKYRDEEKREVEIKRVVVIKEIPAYRNRESTDEETLRKIKEWFPEFSMINEQLKLDEEVIIDYLQKEKTNSILSDKMFKLSGKLTFITRKYIDSFFDSSHVLNCEDGWKAFYKKYPDADGFTSFSRVGFNKSKTQAFLNVSNSSGCLSGFGCVFILEKSNGLWSVKHRTSCWHS